MISKNFNCIFVHVPKTAGQSIEHFFAGINGLSEPEVASILNKRNENPEKGPEWLAHLTAEEYIKYGYVSEQDFTEKFKFSFVRNPWDRLVSEYKFKYYDLKYSFKDFVIKGLPNPSNYSDDYRHVMPQYKYICDQDYNIMVDFVGKFESLQKHFDLICQILYINQTLLPFANMSTKRTGIRYKINRNGIKRCARKFFSRDYCKTYDYKKYYDEELKEIVGNMYAVDISMFKYEFGLPGHQDIPLCDPTILEDS